jgi:hypothetical protein
MLPIGQRCSLRLHAQQRVRHHCVCTAAPIVQVWAAVVAISTCTSTTECDHRLRRCGSRVWAMATVALVATDRYRHVWPLPYVSTSTRQRFGSLQASGSWPLCDLAFSRPCASCEFLAAGSCCQHVSSSRSGVRTCSQRMIKKRTDFASSIVALAGLHDEQQLQRSGQQ